LEPLIDGENIRLTGEVDDRGKQDFLAHAAALLFPIDWPEPFGLVMIEAMACGTPVIAFRRGSVPEVIENGVTGFLHPPDDLDGMAASAIAVLTDPDLHRRVAQEAARRVQERFCDERVVPMYEAVYRNVVDTES
jgi:glycosyltransferase involved in cell wall biosynthesis